MTLLSAFSPYYPEPIKLHKPDRKAHPPSSWYPLTSDVRPWPWPGPKAQKHGLGLGLDLETPSHKALHIKNKKNDLNFFCQFRSKDNTKPLKQGRLFH
jgi:hypothetical protein